MNFARIFWLLMIAAPIMGLVGCFNSPPKGDESCKYKAPTAIFEGIDSFQNHSFEINGQEALEKVSLPRYKMDIELYQSGCDFLKQEYRFLLYEPYPANTPPEICAHQIAGIFLLLARDAPIQLGTMRQWAQAIKNAAADFKYNESIPLVGTDIEAQIDKVHQPESAILSIVFSQ